MSQIIYALRRVRTESPAPALRPLARAALAEYVRHRLLERATNRPEIVGPVARLEIARICADVVGRFDEADSVSQLLELTDCDGIAYALTCVGDAIVYRERDGRLRKRGEGGRAMAPRGLLVSCHWTLAELKPGPRLRLLSGLVRDFLDEDVTALTIRNQINAAEARRFKAAAEDGRLSCEMTAAFRQISLPISAIPAEIAARTDERSGPDPATRRPGWSGSRN